MRYSIVEIHEQISVHDTSGMQFDPKSVPAGAYVQTIGVFSGRELLVKPPLISFAEGCVEWNPSLRSNNVFSDFDQHVLILYCLFFCQKNGPFFLQRDFAVKRNAIFALLGIEKGDILFDIIMSNHKYVLVVMRTVFQVLNDKDMELYISNRVLYHQWTDFLRDPIISEETIAVKQKLRQDLSKLAMELEEIESRLFGDNHIASLIAGGLGDEDFGGWAEAMSEIAPD